MTLATIIAVATTAAAIWQCAYIYAMRRTAYIRRGTLIRTRHGIVQVLRLSTRGILCRNWFGGRVCLHMHDCVRDERGRWYAADWWEVR